MYKILSPVLALALFAGCSKLEDFGDTNVNPAATNTPNVAALLNQVLGQTGADYGAFSNTWPVSGLYCQLLSETRYPDV